MKKKEGKDEEEEEVKEEAEETQHTTVVEYTKGRQQLPRCETMPGRPAMLARRHVLASPGMRSAQ